jgi:hypothetical protein
LQQPPESCCLPRKVEPIWHKAIIKLAAFAKQAAACEKVKKQLKVDNT